MRYAFLADIHANTIALMAVFHDIERQVEIDGIVCLGDIVGYGPDPGQCIELMRKAQELVVSGNHDLAALGKINLGYFSPDAAQAARWTAGQLTESDRAYLAS